MRKINFDNSIIFSLLIVIISFLFMSNMERSYGDQIQDYQNTIYRMEMDSVLRAKELEIERLQNFKDSVTLYQLNWENIDYWLESFNIEHKEIVKQQIFLETGNLKSDICINNRNLFGMRYPRVRETTAIGVRKAHAEYDNYVDSIKDYALWQQNMYNGQHDYYSFLQNVGYAECQTYISKLKYIERRGLI